MSDRTRLALGSFETLPGAVTKGVPVTFCRMVVSGRRVLVGAAASHGAPATCPEVTALRLLEHRMLRHYFRLQGAERRLYARLLRRKRGGREAIRQMERERRRLGSELHTGIGQMLAAIRLQIEVIEARLPGPPEAVGQALGRISALAGDALEQIRSISQRLHPPEWQRLSLEAALEQLWEMSGIPQRFSGSLRLYRLAREPELELKVLFYRAAQEALSNLARHARATRIEMELRAEGDRLTMRIQDNGVGFDAERMWTAPASVTSGIGLRSIREQAAAVSGSLAIESGPSGTTLIVSAPYSAAAMGSQGETWRSSLK